MGGARRLTLQEANNANLACCFDTCVLIDAFNQKFAEERDPVLLVRRGNRSTSVITKWEFLHGTRGQLLNDKNRAERMKFLDEQGIKTARFQGAITIESLIGLRGPPSIQDALIAADCLAWNAALVTATVRHFAQVDRLLLVAVAPAAL